MKIVNYPHPALRIKAKPVTTIDKDVVIAAGRMLELMYKHEGLGLAAPQVALDAQLLVINFVGDAAQKDQEIVAINPIILEQKGVLKDREGCLSFPGLYQDIRRAKTVRARRFSSAAPHPPRAISVRRDSRPPGDRANAVRRQFPPRRVRARLLPGRVPRRWSG